MMMRVRALRDDTINVLVDDHGMSRAEAVAFMNRCDKIAEMVRAGVVP
jgi:hypothetical protein